MSDVGLRRPGTPNMVDYEEACRSFALEVPEYFNFATDVVDGRAGDHTKLALLSVDPGVRPPRSTASGT